MVEVFVFVRVDLELMSRASVLSPLSLNRLEESQDLMSFRQLQREVGGTVEVGSVERQILVLST